MKVSLLYLLVLMFSCGKDDDNDSNSIPTALRVAGSVSGFSALLTPSTETLDLTLNGSEVVHIDGNGDFQFLTGLSPGQSYEIGIKSPSYLSCHIRNNMASGTTFTDIETLYVVCSDIMIDTWNCAYINGSSTFQITARADGNIACNSGTCYGFTWGRSSAEKISIGASEASIDSDGKLQIALVNDPIACTREP